MIFGPKFHINKYSIYELKAGIDFVIEDYLNQEYFDENLKLNNIKLIFIILTIFCAIIGHIYSKPFPDNYYIVLFSLIFYLIFRIIYWYIENILLNDIFFIGTNEYYCHKYRSNKHYTIKEIKFHSNIDFKNPSIYEIWFDFTVYEDNKIFISNKRKIDCTKIYDERGYIYRNRVIQCFKSIFKKELKKID